MSEEQKNMQEEQDKKALELNDVFEYDVVSVLDKDHGGVDVERLGNVLADHASKGWRLVSAFSNEVGRDSSLSEFSGVSIGVNSTIDQNILIFERCVRRYQR